MMRHLTNQSSFNQNISRKITPLFHNFFSIANLINFFGWDQYLRYILAKVAVLNISFKIFFHLAFFPTDST